MVSSGRYQNASEVLREGLRLIEEREARETARLKALQEAAHVGFADLDQGRYCDLRDDELENFITSLGRRATHRVETAGYAAMAADGAREAEGLAWSEGLIGDMVEEPIRHGG